MIKHDIERYPNTFTNLEYHLLCSDCNKWWSYQYDDVKTKCTHCDSENYKDWISFHRGVNNGG